MAEEFLSEIEFPFTQLPTKIWELKLLPSEFSVLTRIIYRAGLRGQCFESRSSIAEACGVSERTVTSAFATLERLQVISIRSRKVEMKPNLIKLKAVAHWLSKRQMDEPEVVPSATIALPLAQPLQEASATIAHGTRSIELDQKELNKEVCLNILIADDPFASATASAGKEKSAGARIFEAYSEAYENRYGVAPLRNAKVNSVAASIAKQLPIQEALAVVHFYCRQNVRWYVEKGHALEYCLKDLQALRTAMLMNKTMSSKAAFELDKQAANHAAANDWRQQSYEQNPFSECFGDNRSDNWKNALPAPNRVLPEKS